MKVIIEISNDISILAWTQFLSSIGGKICNEEKNFEIKTVKGSIEYKSNEEIIVKFGVNNETRK